MVAVAVQVGLRPAVLGLPMGPLGSGLIAFAARRMSWQLLRETLHGTLTISAMAFFILLCAQPFALAFRGLGGEGGR